MFFIYSFKNQADKVTTTYSCTGLLSCTTELSPLVFFVLSLDNPSQVGSVSVTIKVLDVNDNAPEFPRFYEAFVCENAKAGQVRRPVTWLLQITKFALKEIYTPETNSLRNRVLNLSISFSKFIC